MAKSATPDRVGADMQPANFRAAVQVIRTTIEALKTKIGEQNKKIGEHWATVSGHRVNKKAAKFWASMDKMEEDERADVVRSLKGLIDASGWADAQDLVDAAESNVVPLRRGEEAEGEDGDEGNVESGEDKPVPRRGRKPKAAAAEKTVADKAEERKSVLKGLDASRKHLGGGVSEEPYTGDNSDLAGD